MILQENLGPASTHMCRDSFQNNCGPSATVSLSYQIVLPLPLGARSLRAAPTAIGCPGAVGVSVGGSCYRRG